MAKLQIEHVKDLFSEENINNSVKLNFFEELLWDTSIKFKKDNSVSSNRFTYRCHNYKDINPKCLNKMARRFYQNFDKKTDFFYLGFEGDSNSVEYYISLRLDEDNDNKYGYSISESNQKTNYYIYQFSNIETEFGINVFCKFNSDEKHKEKGDLITKYYYVETEKQLSNLKSYLSEVGFDVKFIEKYIEEEKTDNPFFNKKIINLISVSDDSVAFYCPIV